MGEAAEAREARPAYGALEDDVPPGYKRTEVGVIPEEWEVVRLDELVTFASGGTPALSNTALWVGDVPWASSKDMKRSRLCDTEDHVSASAIGNGTRIAGRGSILVVVRGMALAHTLPVALVQADMAFNQDIKALVANKRLDSEFLLYVLQGNEGPVLSLATESTHGTKRLETPELRSHILRVPPLPEQRAIARALSDVDDLISALDRLIEKKRAIKQATMQQLLTGRTRLPGFGREWILRSLGELATITMGQSPESRFYNQTGVGEPLIQGNTEIRNRRSVSTTWTVSCPKRCRAGDILMSVRAPVGAIAIASTDACIGRGVCSIEPMVNSQFLYHALILAESAWDSLRQGSTFQSASSKQVEAFRIPIPASPEEQRAIATILSDMDAEIAALERRREKTRLLKQGMMQELLTGRIRLVETADREVAAG